jgi:hypothetical protein
MEPDALGEREFRTTNGAVEVEDGRAVTRLDVLDGALAIPSAGKLLQRILGRQRAILCKATLGAPSSTGKVGAQRCVQGSPVSAGLASTDDLPKSHVAPNAQVKPNCSA